MWLQLCEDLMKYLDTYNWEGWGYNYKAYRQDGMIMP